MKRGADVFESRRVLAAALIAPAVIFILLLVGTPFVLAIYLSFTDATAGSLSGSWVGLANFSAQWHDPIFRHALRQQDVSGIPAIHYSLGDIYSDAGGVRAIVQIGHCADWSAVHAHAHPQFGKRF